MLCTPRYAVYTYLSGSFVLSHDVGNHGGDVVAGVRLAREEEGTGPSIPPLELGVQIEKIRQEDVELFVHLGFHK